MNRTILAIAFVALIPLSACKSTEVPPTTAPATSRVFGKITASDTGQALTDVAVGFFIESGAPPQKSVRTSSKGKYESEVPPGRYRVLVNPVNEANPLGWNGYAPTWTNGKLTEADPEYITVKPGESTEYNLALQPLWPVSVTVSINGGSMPQGTGYIGAVPFGDDGVFASIPLTGSGKYTFPMPDGQWQVRAGGPGLVEGVSGKFNVRGGPATAPEVTLTRA